MIVPNVPQGRIYREYRFNFNDTIRIPEIFILSFLVFFNLRSQGVSVHLLVSVQHIPEVQLSFLEAY